jgi:hypothetical protein
MAGQKTKIRYNFAENAKRTWNRIKQPAGQATKIEPEVFADHYAQNWEIQPIDILIDEHADFIMQRRIIFKENEMINGLLNKDKMKDAITKKGNSSAPGLDKLTYPILKYEKYATGELMVNIMNMLIKLQKCPEFWKEGKGVMLSKPCNEDEKSKLKIGDL